MNQPRRRVEGVVSRTLCAIFRALPVGLPGKARIARFLLGKVLGQTDTWIQVGSRWDIKMPSLREPIAFHALIDGVYEPEVAGLLGRLLKPGMTFVDVGANVGVFSILASSCVGTSGRVLAFEPSPRVYPYLTENVAANRASSVTTIRMGVSNVADATAAFYCPPDHHFGMGAMAPQFGVAPIEISVDSLDVLLETHGMSHVDVLKVDVEGFEAGVFLGARQLLSGKHAPVVIFEFCDWAESRAPGRWIGEAQSVLRDYGYAIFRLPPDGLARLVTGIITTGSTNLVAYKNRSDGRLTNSMSNR